jgi:hypothetical protein
VKVYYQLIGFKLVETNQGEKVVKIIIKSHKKVVEILQKKKDDSVEKSQKKKIPKEIPQRIIIN